MSRPEFFKLIQEAKEMLEEFSPEVCILINDIASLDDEMRAAIKFAFQIIQDENVKKNEKNNL